ncbi:MAG: type II toxin-antitoxin system HicB family antitoxin [Butyrivibrio sp.]|nr:type II toxin-antitoxin system HicB family antitoxin [Butyrivibrio sp.]
MIAVYPVILTCTHDDKDTYLIEIPDLNGMTEGHGLADAIHMARDYIGCYCYDIENADIPASSSINDIDVSKGMFYEDGVSDITLVDVDIDSYRKKMENRSVRRNVSIPFWLNEAAEEHHINVSKVLQEALKQKLNMA